MLKGHVFSKQLFGNPIFALFINTFLNGTNGVSNNFKNGMKPTSNGTSVTVDSGAICIQGRFLEEDTYTSVPAGTDNAYCKLVIEIDLDKTNTEGEFTQGAYKIIKSASGYPNLTQTDIVKNVSGIYQYELARFRTNAGGITDFKDMRTFLDFNSIYEKITEEYRTVLQELENELANVLDGSDYLLKSTGGTVKGLITAEGGIKGNVTGNCSGSSGSCTGNSATSTKLATKRTIAVSGAVSGSTQFDGSGNVIITTKQANIAVLTGNLVTKGEGTTENPEFSNAQIDFPEGFNPQNCVVISLGLRKGTNNNTYSFGTTSPLDPRTWLRNGLPAMVIFDYKQDKKITLTIETPFTEAYTYSYKIVLMKIA